MSKLLKLAFFVALGYAAYILFFQAEWYTAGSAEDGFTVESPQPPERDTQRRNLKHFGLASIVIYSHQEDFGTFAATVLSSDKIKQGVITEEQIEQGALDRLAKSTKGRLISTETGVHRGVTYTELEYRLDSSSATLYLRTFRTDGRVYVFMAGSHTMTRTFSGHGRFFRSIRFTGS